MRPGRRPHVDFQAVGPPGVAGHGLPERAVLRRGSPATSEPDQVRIVAAYVFLPALFAVPRRSLCLVRAGARREKGMTLANHFGQVGIAGTRGPRVAVRCGACSSVHCSASYCLGWKPRLPSGQSRGALHMFTGMGSGRMTTGAQSGSKMAISANANRQPLSAIRLALALRPSTMIPTTSSTSSSN